MKKVLPLVIIACLSTSAVSAKNSCKDLQIGESLRVKKSPKKSKSGIEMKYTLNRVSENGYDVFINPDFLPHKSYDGKFPSNVTGTITLRKLRPFVNNYIRNDLTIVLATLIKNSMMDIIVKLISRYGIKSCIHL